jgi:hypothetical protein
MLLSRAEDRAMRGRNPSADTGRGWLGYGDMPRRFFDNGTVGTLWKRTYR